MPADDNESDWLVSVRQELERYVDETGETVVTLDAIYEYSEERLAQEFPDNNHIRAKIRQQLQELRDLGEVTFLDDPGIYRIELRNQGDSPAQPSVWIEKTSQEGRPYKQEGELALGKALIAPSRDEGGRRRYETMREADVGDVVLHLLQERHEIVGLSRIASPLIEDFEGPPTNRWTEEQRQQGGYRRNLKEYVELDEPLQIYDDILANEAHADDLRQIRSDTDKKIVYNKRLSLNQGHYFTHVPEDYLRILASESPELAAALEDFDVEVPDSPTRLPPARDSYETLSAAVEDIQDRLGRSHTTNWLAEDLAATIIEDWSVVLKNFGPSTTVSPLEDVRLQQIRQLYQDHATQLEETADSLGVGCLQHLSNGETLFVALLREIQDEAGITTNINQDKIKLILNEEYDIGQSDEDEKTLADHPLIDHLDSQPPTTPVRTFTGPPDYWLTALQYGTVSFEEDEVETWEAVNEGELIFLHSQAEPSNDQVVDQPSGIFGVGIAGAKTTKEGLWWTDETESNPFQHLLSFKRLYVMSNLDQIDFSTPVRTQSPAQLEYQVAALTDGLLSFDRVQKICEETNGTQFPAQGAHKVFRTHSGEPDHARPRALLAELADKLQETATVNTRAEFTASLSTEPLSDLHFPDDGAKEIINQIESALRTGKHIILTGPPGTGKTEIARRVCAALASEHPYLYSDYQVTTATADWSTFDTVGGYMPEESADDGSDLSFTPGIVLNRLKERTTGRQLNEPIVIDELNRADIDKAFGQLFTLLSGQSVQLPYTRDGAEIELVNTDQIQHHPDSHQYVVPDSWRIFATMNTYDKTSLYEMSYAFMRRFAFIRVSAPTLPAEDDALRDLMYDYANEDVWDIDARPSELLDVGRVWRAMNTAVEDRAIGPAIVEDILAAVTDNETIPFEDRLTRAVINYIFPQLEGVPKRERIITEIAAVDRINEDTLNQAAIDMLQVSLQDDE